MPIGPTTVAMVRAHKVTQAAGVRHIGLHGSRHFAISEWLSAGLSPVLVAKYAGHSDAGVTMRVYALVIRDDDSRARGAMEGTLYGTA